MEFIGSGRLENTTKEQLSKELKRLYATIKAMRNILARYDQLQVLGESDIKILSETAAPKSEKELSKKESTGLSVGYLSVKLPRLEAMGCIKQKKVDGVVFWKRTELGNALLL